MSQDPTFTVRNVATAIREVANTRLLGTELDLSSVCLDKIAKHDASEHNLRLVEAWLRLDPNPTWRKLVEALRSPLVEENTIAQEIEENYILRRGSITSDFSSPPASPMSLGSVPSPSSSLTSSMFRSGSSGDRNVDTLRQRNFQQMEQHFSTFLGKVKSSLIEEAVQVEEFCSYIVPLYPEIPETVMGSIPSIFEYLTRERLWDFWNYHHLGGIIGLFGGNKIKICELQKLEDVYKGKLSGFLATTKISDYLLRNREQEHKVGRPSNSRRRNSKAYRDTLSMKLVNVKMETDTLQYVEDLWKKLDYLGLPKTGVLLDRIHGGCILVIWLVSSEITETFCEKALGERTFYEENSISRVTLNDECIYAAPKIAEEVTDIVKEETADTVKSKVEAIGTVATTADTVKSKTEATGTVTTKDETADTVKSKVATFLQKVAKPFKKKTDSERLLEACRAKKADLSAVKDYLSRENIDVNIRENDKFQWTPLMWACENGHTEIGKLLLKRQPKVNIQDSKLWSALILASRRGDLELVQGLLDHGAEIDMQTNKKWTPLMWAAQEGKTEVAKLLLERGAKVDEPDENGWTPLMQASQEGHSDVVDVLLDHNANINHQSNSTWCAVMAATKNNRNAALETLLSRGADVDIARSDGSTALEVASFYKDHSEVMMTLIKHGAKVDHQNKDGMTALMLAINKGHLDLVQTLVNGKADLNKTHPETGWTAIFFAAKSGNLEIFRELLKGGADTEIEGMKVADVASLFKRGKILSELKKSEQAANARTQLSSHVPTLEAVQPTSGELETRFSETKVEVSSEGTQSTEPDLEPSGTEPTEPAVIKEERIEREVDSVSTTLDVPEATAPVVAKDTNEAIDHQGSVQQSDTTTTTTTTTTTPEVQEQEPSIIPSVEDTSLPSEPQEQSTQPEQEAKQPSHVTPAATKHTESPQTTEKAKEAKKPAMDLKQKAAYLDLIMKAMEWKMKNLNKNPQDYNSEDIMNSRSRPKGIVSDEDLTHGRERSIQEDYKPLHYDTIDH